MSEGGSPAHKLIAVTIDENSLGNSSLEAAHDRKIAIYDLLADNSFAIPGDVRGPYRLTLAMVQRYLVFQVQDEAESDVVAHILSLGPFRPVVADYQILCERHYAAVRSASPSQIEAIDMGRRGLHNDGAKLLMGRLAGKIEMDFATARRLFTLIVALHWER
jgi:uncharacterized protein (UPF0262 family)